MKNHFTTICDRGLHRPDFSGMGPTRPIRQHSWPGPARSKNANFGSGPAWPKREINALARAQPKTKYKILAQTCPDQSFFQFWPGSFRFK